MKEKEELGNLSNENQIEDHAKGDQFVIIKFIAFFVLIVLAVIFLFNGFGDSANSR